MYARKLLVPFVRDRLRPDRSLLTLRNAVVGLLGVIALWLAVAAPPALAGTADVVLSGNVTFTEKVTIPAGEVWEFDPTTPTTVETSFNLIVHGTLRMNPASASVVHTLRFTGIDESKVVGGGMAPLNTDVGLWVTVDGMLDINGTAKTAWGYDWDPGWDGDEVVAAPNTPGDYDGFKTVTKSTVPEPNSLGFKTELMNLTRNVRIEGTATGRAHVFINSTRPQTIRYAAIRWVAPDLFDPDSRDQNQDQTGRYGLHFHHNGDGSRGSIVEGVVIRDAGNHAFVPHASHGITLRDSIAFDVKNEAYWWDPRIGDTTDNSTHDVLYDHVIAALVESTGHRTAAFQLNEGDNPIVIDSVAVGVQSGGADNSGFFWPGGEDGVWTFQRNRSHNNKGHGTFVWQNTPRTHIIEDFTSYYNDKAGVAHGSYVNSYVYLDLTLLGNEVAVESHALGRPATDGGTDTQHWEGLTTNGGGLRIETHNLPPQSPVRFVDCDFGTVTLNEGAHPGSYDFIDCNLEPDDFNLVSVQPDTVFRVQRPNGTAFQLMGTGSVTTIPAFFSGGGPTPGSSFTDIAGSVFAADILWLADEGITQGCNPPTNSKFCPDDHVTRGQMAAFLSRALDLPVATRDFFGDDAGSVFEGDINKLAASGITLGCNPPANDSFCPHDEVSRGAMAAFLARALGLSPGPDQFVDDDTSLFEADINTLAASGITSGCNPPTNDRFCPNDPVTRGAMAAFLHRAEAWLP